MNNKLTVIVTFRNEGDEVQETVKSIRGHSSDNVSIILVDDASDDRYDYASIAKTYHCRFLPLHQSFGPARARALGVRACETEYFVLMDGHMRLYDPRWEEQVLTALSLHPASIICSSTTNIADQHSGPAYSSGGFGAYLDFAPGKEYTLKWAEKELKISDPNHPSDPAVRPIISILGAFYATSKKHWDNIGGLDGLVGYGFEETWLSLKTWLVGGNCYSLKNLVTGHLYRATPPTKINSELYYANQILMNKFFTLDQNVAKEYELNLKSYLGDVGFAAAEREFSQQLPWFENFKSAFYSSHATRPLSELLKLNQTLL